MKKFTQLDSGIIVPSSRTEISKDGLFNIASGLGTSKSKRSHNQWSQSLISFGELDAIYQSNWIAAAIVNEFAFDIVKKWRTVRSKYAEEIQRAERDYHLKSTVREACQWARLYGGAGVVIISNQDLEKPFDPNKIKKGSLKRLLTFDRYDLVASGDINTYDLLSDDYMRPEYFTLNGGSQRIHRSHIAFFQGAELPKRQARINFGWGDSELRRVIDDVNDAVASKGGLAELMQEANLDVITKDDLFDRIATDQDDQITKRYEIFSLMKSSINMALLDSEEKLDRHTLQLSGVSPLLEVFMVWIAGAARMPMTKIFGVSASGLSATGEGDRKNYNSNIVGHQERLERPMAKLDEVIIRSSLGFMPDDYDFEWNPIEDLNGVEIAQEQLLKAQKASIYLEDGIIMRSQVQRELESGEEYQFEEGAIDKLAKSEAGDLLDFAHDDDDSTIFDDDEDKE